MTRTKCMTSAMLEVGSHFTKTLSFSHEQVARYCDLTGDHNAIHRELDAARLRFPNVQDIIVPGGLNPRPQSRGSSALNFLEMVPSGYPLFPNDSAIRSAPTTKFGSVS